MKAVNFGSCSFLEDSVVNGVTLLPTNGTCPDTLGAVKRALEEMGFKVEIAAPVEMPVSTYDRSRRQYRADRLLDVARQHQGRVVLVSKDDLYAGSLNFVFGLAERPGRAAVVSLYRLYESAVAQLVNLRAVKEVVHEIGHTFGLTHCPNPTCVMSFSNGIREVDRKSPDFCPRCTSSIPFELRTVEIPEGMAADGGTWRK